MLWSTQLFPGPVPPVLPFNLGSLGFMANFQIQDFKKQMKEFITGKSARPARIDDGEATKGCVGVPILLGRLVVVASIGVFSLF